MKKILGIIAFFFMVTLAGCFSNSYSADTLKENLTKGGYTVVENPTIANLETSKLEGLQKVLYAYTDETGLLLFIFDTTEHANKPTEGSTVSTEVGLIMDWGKINAKDNAEFGTSNNVMYSGDKTARKTAGITTGLD